MAMLRRVRNSRRYYYYYYYYYDSIKQRLYQTSFVIFVCTSLRQYLVELCFVISVRDVQQSASIPVKVNVGFPSVMQFISYKSTHRIRIVA